MNYVYCILNIFKLTFINSNHINNKYMNDLKPSTIDFKSENISEKTIQSLDPLYKYVVTTTDKAIDWYYKKKKLKRFLGLWLRIVAIVLIALAGILPILILINECGNAAWSSIIVALAALMIAIDKFGGFTSGWIRYVMATQKLNQVLEEFRFGWESQKLSLRDKPLSPDELQSLIKNCQETLQKVQTIVSDETLKWVAEFQSALNELEAAAKVAADSAKSSAKALEEGAVAINVSNGASSEDSWSVSVNGVLASTYTGNSAALVNQKPGIITIKITGKIGGKNVQDEKPVTVKAGEITSVSMTLV